MGLSGGGQVISLHAFHFHNPSSNPGPGGIYKVQRRLVMLK